MFFRSLLTAATCSILLSATTPAFASGSDLDVSFRYWKPSFNATYSDQTTSLDVKSKLGLADKKVGEFLISSNVGKADQLRLSYFSISTTGVSANGFTSGSWNVPAGYSTTAKISNTQLSWVHYINKEEDADTDFGVLAGLRSLKIDANSTKAFLPTVNKNFNAVLPFIGISVETGKSSPISGFASLSGIYAGSKGHFVDGEIGIKSFLDTNKNLSVSAGYRSFKVYAKNSSDEKIDFKLSGPFFAADYKF